MKHKVTQEFRDMKIEELHQQVEDLRRALFSLRLNATTSHVKDCSQFKKLRRTIARGLTVLGEKQDYLIVERIKQIIEEHNNE